MEKAKAIELLKMAVPQDESLDEEGLFIEAVSMAISALEGKDTNVPANSALDHIHNVVAEREYQRGYEQGKAETNCPEIPDSWTPVTKKMPEEKDTMFAKYWGTDRWNKYMFRRKSELVEVTVELEDGTRYTDASRTYDGKWDVEERHGAVKKKVVAWKPMSAPWRGE